VGTQSFKEWYSWQVKGNLMSNESSLTSDDKVFNIIIRDIDDNIRHNHTARYSEQYVALKGYNEQTLIVMALDALKAKIIKQFQLTEVVEKKPSVPVASNKEALDSWLEHEFENSTNVMSAAYNEAKGFLDVMFKNGHEYRYKEVPVTVFDDLKKSESAGKFLTQIIKGKYKFEKLEDAGE